MPETTKDLPEYIYIYLDKDGEEIYPTAVYETEAAAGPDEVRRVGKYRLETLMDVTMKASVVELVQKKS